jgi:hypothetical protein
MNRYHEGQQVEGIVTNVVDFGAFIALDDGLEGLLHLSEMGDGLLKEPYSYVKKGDRLPLRISRLEPDKRRVGFTQRWGMPPVNADGQTAEGEAGASDGESDAYGAVSESPADVVDVVDSVDALIVSDEVANNEPSDEAAEAESSETVE